MTPIRPPFLLLLFFIIFPSAIADANDANDANDNCRLCSSSSQKIGAEIRERPIRIDITTQLDFSKAALTGSGGGAILISAQNGARQMNGSLVDLGGYSVAGTAIITGEPGRHIRVDMPGNAIMKSANGGNIEITDLRTTLSPAPMLDHFGRLEFSFGGRLVIRGNASGKFRGRIPINAQYE